MTFCAGSRVMVRQDAPSGFDKVKGRQGIITHRDSPTQWAVDVGETYSGGVNHWYIPEKYLVGLDIILDPSDRYESSLIAKAIEYRKVKEAFDTAKAALESFDTAA